MPSDHRSRSLTAPTVLPRPASSGASPSRRRFTAGALVTTAALALGAGPTRAQTVVAAATRRCATCDFWGGKRIAAADKSGVTIEPGATGICSNPRSPLYNRASRSDQLFDAGYKRWRDLE